MIDFFKIIKPIVNRPYFLSLGAISYVIYKSFSKHYLAKRQLMNLTEEYYFNFQTLYEHNRPEQITQNSWDACLEFYNEIQDKLSDAEKNNLPKLVFNDNPTAMTSALEDFNHRHYILFNIEMLNSLNSEEIKACLAHELGHDLLGHINSTQLILTSLNNAANQLITNSYFIDDDHLMPTIYLNATHILAGLGFLLLVGIYRDRSHKIVTENALAFGLLKGLPVIVGYLTARYLQPKEYDADRKSIGLINKPAALISGLKKLDAEEGVNNDSLPSIFSLMKSKFASHPKTEDRVRLIQSLSSYSTL